MLFSIRAGRVFTCGLLLAQILFLSPAFAGDIAGTSFEEPAPGPPGIRYTDTGDSSVDHPLANNAGEPPVNFTSTGGELGFNAFYTNTRGDVGLTDGDFVGVTDFTGTVGSFTDGVQGYQLQDADGLMTVTFDTVLLPAIASVEIDLFVQATGYESEDRIRIWAETPDGDINLLDTTGKDIDDLGIEGTWFTLSANLSGASEATLKVELDSNSASETIYIDNVCFREEVPALVPIMEIQGSSHISPLLIDPANRTEEVDGFSGDLEAFHSIAKIKTSGVVTAVAFNGYYLQDPNGDGDAHTSDGIFVSKFGFKPSVGDEVIVEATITELFPGDAATGNLPVTQLTDSFFTFIRQTELPEPVIIGTSGRIPPSTDAISKDELPTNLQDPGDVLTNNFDPENDGIDFFESLEGMLVTVENPVCVSGLRSFGNFSSEVFTLTNMGDNISPADARTARGGINLQPELDNTGDQNPERVQIQFDASLARQGTLYPDFAPILNLGDQLGNVTGVVGYSFGNFEVNATEIVSVTSVNLEAETTELASGNKQLTVASYNVLNLSPNSKDDTQRTLIARQIVENLNTPDIIALQEIQDNNGETDDGTTDASETLQKLVDAIVSEGGPAYEFFDVAPEDGASGGIPGGNIRNAFLYNSDRVKLVSFQSLTEEALLEAGVSNPTAFSGTRNPLLGVFKFRGKKLTVINNHLTSRFGSTPVFGGIQPFIQAGEAEREAQLTALNEFVNGLLCKKHNANIIVLGDLNTMEFTNDLTDILPQGIDWWGKSGKGRLQILRRVLSLLLRFYSPYQIHPRWFTPRPVLKNLIDDLEDDNVYTFIFEGNSQVLDHMFVTKDLAKIAKFDIVHTNVDFFRPDDDFDLDNDGNPDGEIVGSDHEPLLAEFNFGAKRKRGRKK